MTLVSGVKCKIMGKKRPEEHSSSRQIQEGEVLMVVFDRRSLLN